jgi:exopolysaccharide biosynthesis polyprenyl glycosylphosphotransferase
MNMIRQFSRRRITTLLVYDILVVQLALYLASLAHSRLGAAPARLRSVLQAIGVQGAMPDSPAYLQVELPVYGLAAGVWMFGMIVFGLYIGSRNPTLKVELTNLFLACLGGLFGMATLLYFTYRDTPRLVLGMFFVFAFVLLSAARMALWLYRRSQAGARGMTRRPVIVVGAGPVGQNVASTFRHYAWHTLDVVGYLDDQLPSGSMCSDGLPILGALSEARAITQARGIYDAVVTLPLRAHEQLTDVCRSMQDAGVHVRVVPDLFALSFPNVALDGFGGIPLIDLGTPSIYGRKRAIKRAFDVLAALVILALLSPLMVAVALAVKLNSRGPVFYRQERIGENGRPFRMIKFRSMYTGVDSSVHKDYVTRLIRENVDVADSNSTLKLRNDSRITPVGRVIRRTSLDELPQFFNVLRGEMSLVGPRPSIPYEVEMYKDWHRRRLHAIPGITGYWQVNGRSRVSFEEMVRMDIYYIENQSVWLDLQLLLKTPLAMMRGSG